MAKVRAGGDQIGRTRPTKISETPRNQNKGSTGDAQRGYTGSIKFTKARGH